MQDVSSLLKLSTEPIDKYQYRHLSNKIGSIEKFYTRHKRTFLHFKNHTFKTLSRISDKFI